MISLAIRDVLHLHQVPVTATGCKGGEMSPSLDYQLRYWLSAPFFPPVSKGECWPVEGRGQRELGLGFPCGRGVGVGEVTVNCPDHQYRV